MKRVSKIGVLNRSTHNNPANGRIFLELAFVRRASERATLQLSTPNITSSLCTPNARDTH